MKTYHLALDLKDDPDLIQQYINYHQKVWPEIIESIKEAGVERMDIFNTGNRLFMVMEVHEDFSFDRKSELDRANEKVQEWEGIMDALQQRIPGSPKGSKWVVMDKIFSLP